MLSARSCATIDGFVAPPRSDLFRNTPNLDIDIDRDRASLYGVSTAKLQNLLRAAYSQNYVYLIKKPDDQYQVILEVDDNDRSSPERFAAALREAGRCQPEADSDSNPDEVRNQSSVSNRSTTPNQFTSVTFGFDTKPGVALGDVTAFIQKTAAETLPPTVKGEIQGEGLVLQQLFQALPFLILGCALRHVRHPRNSLRELCPSDHCAFSLVPCRRRGIAHALAVSVPRFRFIPSSACFS